jgi:hypothetical protein
MKIWSDFGASGRVRAHFPAMDLTDVLCFSGKSFGTGTRGSIITIRFSVHIGKAPL